MKEGLIEYYYPASFMLLHVNIQRNVGIICFVISEHRPDNHYQYSQVLPWITMFWISELVIIECIYENFRNES